MRGGEAEKGLLLPVDKGSVRSGATVLRASLRPCSVGLCELSEASLANYNGRGVRFGHGTPAYRSWSEFRYSDHQRTVGVSGGPTRMKLLVRCPLEGHSGRISKILYSLGQEATQREGQ